ncbi:MAG: hypothetical protein ACLPIC_08210 [Rhodoblastus sp.]|uniref:hypothetical protein n=2 Tax=Rhodoblastus sp. TaxID=1962975 RepID=UPI003F95E3F6
MRKIRKLKIASLLFTGVTFSLACGAAAADALEGLVLAGGQPVANSTVTLWAASSGAPQQIAQARTDAEGRFTFGSTGAPGADASLYLIAKGGHSAADKTGGDNPALALMTVAGGKPPSHVTINEMTTVASVWTHAQFIDGAEIRGHALGLRIAAGNVPNFVDLQTGGYGEAIAGPLNSSQTPTLANFATLSNVLAGCATRVKAEACDSLFAAATGPDGKAPADTLSAAQSIARVPWHKPEKIFALLEDFYPVDKDQSQLRPAPFTPYLSFAPSAWVLPLKFSGGGLSGGGKLMFDSQGNAWVADNFMVGAQNQDALWRGGLSKFAPDGKPLSPAVSGFTGGGLLGPGFGLAIDAHDNPWLTSFGGNTTVSVFDNSGKPLSPPEGYNFDGKISKMQGIIATPGGDIWAIDTMKSQVVRFPKGDTSKGELLCQNPSSDPLKNPCKLLTPFAVAVDQNSNIWVTNFLADHVTRFPGGDVTKPETFKTGFSSSGLAVDSLGNVWIANKLGSSEWARLKTLEMAVAGKVNYDGDRDASSRITRVLVAAMVEQKPGWEGGSLTVLHPDGSEAAFSPVYGKGIYGPWAVSVDGNDNIWVSNFTSSAAGIVQLCGFRTENCPSGIKTGDAISPPGGYVGGGLQLQVDVGIGPAGDVWVTNNWQDHASCFGKPDETVSTRCAGEGVVVFFGMAKPVQTPLVGPPRQP